MSTRKHMDKHMGAWCYFSRTHQQEAQVRHLQFPGWLFIYCFCTVNFTPPLISKAAASDLFWHTIFMLIFQVFLSYGVNEEVTGVTKALWVKPSVLSVVWWPWPVWLLGTGDHPSNDTMKRSRETQSSFKTTLKSPCRSPQLPWETWGKLKHTVLTWKNLCWWIFMCTVSFCS